MHIINKCDLKSLLLIFLTCKMDPELLLLLAESGVSDSSIGVCPGPSMQPANAGLEGLPIALWGL